MASHKCIFASVKLVLQRHLLINHVMYYQVCRFDYRNAKFIDLLGNFEDKNLETNS